MDPLFLIEHFDPADRRAWFSCDRNWTLRNIIEGIADGQMECVVRVLEIHEPEDGGPGWVVVITRDIADAVSARLASEGREPSYEVLTFLHANGLRQLEMAE